jgi:hypothetical protein
MNLVSAVYGYLGSMPTFLITVPIVESKKFGRKNSLMMFWTMSSISMAFSGYLVY